MGGVLAAGVCSVVIFLAALAQTIAFCPTSSLSPDSSTFQACDRLLQIMLITPALRHSQGSFTSPVSWFCVLGLHPGCAFIISTTEV